LTILWHTTTHTTTTILWPLCRSTCISRQLQLRTGGFVGAKFYYPQTLADGYQCIQIREKTLEFSSTVLSMQSPYLHIYLRNPMAYKDAKYSMI